MKKVVSMVILAVVLLGIVLLLSACNSPDPASYINNLLAPIRSLSTSITHMFQGFHINIGH